MKPSREKLLALAILLAVLIVNAAGLWPEISISRIDLNDNVFHFTLVERMVQAIQNGENPLDCWSPEWTLGYPVLRTYQPLAHLLVALAYLALRKSAGLMTVFVWARFLSVALLPLSFFAAARLLGLPPLTAAAASILSPLISTNFLYGVEYGSFTWAGSGLFPQAIGTHFLLITLGLAFRAIRRGRHLVLTGALLGLTFLAHLIYGYMGALSICLLAAIPDPDIPRLVRLYRVAIVGAVALLLSAFQLAPLLLDGSINHSRWEPVWKWDSFGAGQVLKWLFTGALLDFGRLPALTLLALAGIVLFLWKNRPTHPEQTFLICGAAFWLLMFFGRPFWGPLLTLLGVSADMQLHRVIGGVHIFLLFLAAIALAEMWDQLAHRWHYTLAVAATILLLYPVVRERAHYLSDNAEWGTKNLAANPAEHDALDATIAAAKNRGGRAYAGLSASWGGKFKIGDVPFYAFFSEANIPAVAFLYHSMALTSDVMLRFNEWNPFHYTLFNIRTVVVPAGPDPPQVPPFLKPIGQNGRFRIFAAPVGSYFDIVDVIASVKVTRNNFYDVNDRWLQSDWLFKRAHLWLDWRGEALDRMPRLAPEDALPQMPVLPAPGQVRGEQRNGEVYQADLDVIRPSYALFKMTWHANWKASIDGKPKKTIMISPGFVGVPLPPGPHKIRLQYQPESWKTALALIGLCAVALLLVLESRIPIPVGQTSAWKVLRPGVLTAAGLILLAAPICIPLFTGSVLWGHDGFVYFPRLVEVHQNIIHGNLLPRWAPDLGRGTGQPLFLFHPPMIYYIGEFWHLLGADFVTAMNLACVVIVLLSALAMFLLARLYFGEAGGWLGAAAYLYAPYFAVDLYVRSAMEEFAAFPFFALALYGFGAYARFHKSRHWLLGVMAYACVLFCHFPAALLFTPLLLAFLPLTAWMEKSWSVLWKQAVGFLLGLGISAFIWVPALAARQYAAMDRAVQGNGKFSNHFVYLHQLFYSPWGYGLSLPGPDDGMSFALGWSHLLLAAVVWIWLSRNPKLGDRRLLRFFSTAALLLSILMLQDALWFWTQVPFLQNVQLPWRLLAPVAVCLALVIAPLGNLLNSIPRWRTAGIALAMALLIVPNLSHLHTRQPVDVDLSFWTPQQLSLRGFETTTMAEVSPRWMKGIPSYTPAAATILSGDAVIESPARAPFSWSSPVSAKVVSTIEMNTAWFPGWQVLIDHRAVPAGPGTQSGLITFQVPAGEHSVQVQYGRTTTEAVSAAASLCALIVAFIFARTVARL